MAATPLDGGNAKTSRRSAGILLWRRRDGEVQVLLVHPGGPFWVRRDAGAWSIPKGEYAEGEEDALAAARRELVEELGPAAAPLAAMADGAFEHLGEIRQKGGKRVTAFALEGDVDVSQIVSNVFEREWPPRSGKKRSFPEVDRAEWLSLAEAREKILSGQLALLDRLAAANWDQRSV